MCRWLLTALAISYGALAQAALVPEGFVVPDSLEHPLFSLRPISQQHAEADFAAVTESRDKLRKLFGGDWPGDEFTVEENRQDIAFHEQQFAAREAFTYAVLDASGRRVLGSVYIVPAQSPGFDAAILYWTRAGETGLNRVLARAVARWLQDAWPFRRIEILNRS